MMCASTLPSRTLARRGCTVRNEADHICIGHLKHAHVAKFTFPLARLGSVSPSSEILSRFRADCTLFKPNDGVAHDEFGHYAELPP